MIKIDYNFFCWRFLMEGRPSELEAQIGAVVALGAGI